MDYNPQTPYANCSAVLEFRLNKGEHQSGFFYSRTTAERGPTLQIEDGTTVDGPVFISVCGEGHLVIYNPQRVK